MVEAAGLTKVFGTFTAVDHVDLRVSAGDIFGFLGANGAGKTTTIRMLCGLLTSSGGSGRVAGFDIDRESEQVKSVIGYMSQKFSLYTALTVRENLEFFGGMYRLSWDRIRQRIPQVAGLTGLEGFESRIVEDLPGGIRQRVALASALLHEPRVLFLDEPTAGVDPSLRRKFWSVIDGLASAGTTVFVTTHYMDEVEHCHSVALMARGRIVDQGSLADVRRRAFPGRVFEIAVDDPTAASNALAGKERVCDWSVHGATIHLFPSVQDESTAPGEMGKILSAAGVRHAAPAVIEPGMDDVFIRVIRSAEVRP
jgi:ABC-2 type transport system ATP-binding protein